MRDVDTLIIGAGAAGLAAAAELARAGRSALVLEARGRIGGRVWTLKEPGLTVPVELGAEFIHGRPAATFTLLKRAGIAAIPRAGSGWYVERGRLQHTGEIFAEIRAALRATGAPKPDVSFETFLNRELRHLSERARTFARMRVQGYDAADPARASARMIVEEWTGEDEATTTTNSRPRGGYGALLSWLAGSLEGSTVRIQLQTVVRSVKWQRGTVEVEGDFRGRPFQASAARAIVTLPLGVLQHVSSAPGAVRFSPVLDQKRQALQGLAPSPVLKVALRFRDAFWEQAGRGRYRDAVFFRSPGAAIPSFWTARPTRAPLLIAWAGGPKAMRLTGTGAPHIIRQAVTSLKSVFGAGAGKGLAAAWVHDWQEDPYARGAYSYVTVGGAGARKALAAPLRGTLFFAGEAADFEGEHGTVAGALQSGRRAAALIAAR
jgi:monoamine oxidase